MTELLVVMGIIVLFITLALPAFNLITGSRSIAAGTNEVAAFLGRARAEAIGLQQIRGVAFYVDAATGRSTMAIVHQPFQETPSAVLNAASATTAVSTYVMPSSGVYKIWDGTTLQPANYNDIDAESDVDVLPLPVGVGAQLLNNATITAGARTTNGYVSFGAILFDGSGNLVSRPIAISEYGTIGKSSALSVDLPNVATTISSQFGVVLFDLQAYGTVGGSMSPQLIFGANAATYSSSGEKAQEGWLDTNSTPLLINRYNGTLIKSE